MKETALIIVEIPNRCLSPNNSPASKRGHFMKAAAKKKAKKISRLAAEELCIETGPWDRATAQATFYHARRRDRDDDNYIALLKSTFDGIVEAGLLTDDSTEHLTHAKPLFEVDRGRPRVEITITRED